MPFRVTNDLMISDAGEKISSFCHHRLYIMVILITHSLVIYNSLSIKSNRFLKKILVFLKLK